MIKGIGIDSVEKSRVKHIYSEYGKKLVDRLLGPNESHEISSKVGIYQQSRYLFNNFACKEAVAKSLGLGFRNGVSFKEIEILRDKNGRPYVQLLGKTKQIFDELDMHNLHVTITDTRNTSTAFVIGESL